MIKINTHRAKININAGKNGTFLEGEIYIGRMSKDGSFYVVKSEEGYWIPLIHYRYAKSLKDRFDSVFEKFSEPFYVNNYKELRK